ncbi:MAG: hypothetical protein ACT4PI_11385 [Actinomycetota bacterium]
MTAVRLVLLGSAAALVLVACGPVKKSPPQFATFICSGGAQSWTVPSGVTQATFDLFGAQGGNGSQGLTMGGGTGANGGRTTATLAVTPGESIQVNVGCRGGNAAGTGGTATVGTAGFNGGAAGGVGDVNGGAGGGGGGASDIRGAGTDLANRALVAAGGGGGGGGTGVAGAAGGGGGHPDGAAGGGGVTGGGGGTQTMGGAGGGGDALSDGTLGNGGPAGSVSPASGGGGGGAGGLYGGGGGQTTTSGGGGGGGSSFGPGGAVFQNGVQGGHGIVIITYKA